MIAIDRGRWRPLWLRRPVTSAASVPRAGLTPLGAILAAVVAYLGGRAWADYDVYWHLANGRLQAEGFSPTPDRFSWSMAGADYLDYSAPIERLYYAAWTAGGPALLGLLAAIGLALAFLPYAILIGRLQLHPLVEGLTLFAIIYAIFPFRGERPHLVGFIIFGLLVLLADRPFTLRRAIACGLLLGSWAHLHGTFGIGFGLIGLAALSCLWARDWWAAGRAVLAIVLGGALSLLTPYDVELWVAPFRSVTNITAAYNADWASLRPFNPALAASGIVLLVAIAVGVWRAADPRALAALALALPAIQLVRFAPFAIPLLALVTVERLAARHPRLTLATDHPLRLPRNVQRLGRCALFILVVGIAVPLAVVPRPPTIEAAALGNTPVPLTAVDTLLSCAEPGPVWSDYNWSGYLLWRGEARFTVGVDGRAETLYTDSVFRDYITVLFGAYGWETIVQQSPARYALVAADAAAPFRSLEGWHEVYRDDTAAIAAREGATWRCPR